MVSTGMISNRERLIFSTAVGKTVPLPLEHPSMYLCQAMVPYRSGWERLRCMPKTNRELCLEVV